MTSKEKVAALREEMQKNNVDAFIVYSADPHMSEYLPEEWQEGPGQVGISRNRLEYDTIKRKY